MILLTKNLIVRMFDFCSMINTLSTNFFCIYKLLSNPGEKTLVRLAKEKKKRKKHYMTIFLIIGCESPLMAPTEFKVKNTKRKEIKKIISRCQWQNDHGLLVTNLIFFFTNIHQVKNKLKFNKIVPNSWLTSLLSKQLLLRFKPDDKKKCHGRVKGRAEKNKESSLFS